MRFPWAKTERRAIDYTDAIIQNAYNAATGDVLVRKRHWGRWRR